MNSDAVVVVGMGLMTPQASSPQEYWRLLLNGDSEFTAPGERFDASAYRYPPGGPLDKTRTRVSGYIHQPPPAAEQPAPRDRSMTAQWLRHCLIQATQGLDLRTTARTIFVVGAVPAGIPELEDQIVRHGFSLHGRPVIGYRSRPLNGQLPHRIARDAAAGILHPRADILAVDTACSAALCAIDVAMQALHSGQQDVAVCGGVYALGPFAAIALEKMEGLSTRGQISPFDPDADGIVFADGAALVVLTLLSRARAAGVPVAGVLGGMGASHAGHEKPLTSPHVDSQILAARRALETASLPAGAVDCIIAHGTGTPAGDAAEARSLRAVYDGHGERTRHLVSNKALVGHTTAAAGALSLIHALLALEHNVIPAQRHHRTPITALSGSALTVPTRHQPWPTPGPERVAAVCGYGLGGASFHLLVRDLRAVAASPAASPQPDAEPVVAIAWAAYLPGNPAPADITAWLLGHAAAPPPAFAPSCPAPLPGEFRIPAATLRACDTGEVIALRLYRALAAPFGDQLTALNASTGVFAAQPAPTAAQILYTLRCHIDAVRPLLPERIWAERARQVRAAIPPLGEHALAGSLTNTIASRVAAYHDLLGTAMSIDTGPASGITALRIAALYLGSRRLDVAMVCGVNGQALPELDLITTGIRPAGTTVAEGGFALLLTRLSTAAANSWPILARVDIAASTSDTRRVRASVLHDRSYLGADGLLPLIQACAGHDRG